MSANDGAAIRDRREWVIPAGVWVVALGLRLAVAGAYAAHPLGQLPWVDEGAYWARAAEIADGRLLPSAPFYQDPLFPYLLASLMAPFGPEVGRLRLALACLGSLTPVVLTLTGLRLGGRAVGLAAGLLAALCGPLVFADVVLEKEGPAALLAALGTFAVVRSVQRARWASWVGAGFVWGGVALLRANALILAPLGAGWILAERGLGPAPGRGRMAGGWIVGFVLALAPATLVNLWVARPTELILTTWQLGANFYVGNGPEATGTYAAPEFVRANPAFEGADFTAEARRRAGHRLSPKEVSRFWLRAGLDRWTDDPGGAVRLLRYKLAMVVHDREIPDNQDAAVVRAVAAPALGLAPVGFGVLAVLAAWGLPSGLRDPIGRFLALSVVAGLGTTALFFVVGRYRVPWLPGLVLLAATGGVDLLSRLRRCDPSGLPARLGLAVLASWCAWRPLVDPAPDRWGHAEIALATAYLAAGQLDPAIDALDDARALGPGPAARVEELVAAGGLRGPLERLVRRAAAADPGLDTWRIVRRLRLLPDRRPEAEALAREALARTGPTPALLRELVAARLASGSLDAADRRMLHSAAATDPSAAILLTLISRQDATVPVRDADASSQRGRRRLAQLIVRRKT